MGMQGLEQAEQVVDTLAQQRPIDVQREESFPGVAVTQRVASFGRGGWSGRSHAPQVGQHNAPAAFRKPHLPARPRLVRWLDRHPL